MEEVALPTGCKCPRESLLALIADAPIDVSPQPHVRPFSGSLAASTPSAGDTTPFIATIAARH